MVEKIIINPNEVRGYGNILNPTSITDYEVNKSILSLTTDTIDNRTRTVYELMYTLYGFIFSVDTENSQLYVQTEQDDQLTLGFDSSNEQLYLINDTEDSAYIGFDSVHEQLFIEVGA